MTSGHRDWRIGGATGIESTGVYSEQPGACPGRTSFWGMLVLRGWSGVWKKALRRAWDAEHLLTGSTCNRLRSKVYAYSPGTLERRREICLEKAMR